MKNFLLAVLIGGILMYALGDTVSDWWGIHLMMNNEMFSPAESLFAFSAIAVLFVIIGFIVAVSVVGTIALVGLTVMAALAVAGISTFWPVLLVVGVIWLILRNRNAPQENRQSH